MNKFYIRILGATYKADFIIIILAIIGLITIINHLIKTHRKSNWLEEAQEKQQRRFEYMNKAILDQPKERKFTPTGWYWDEMREEWIPPDYLKIESDKNWRWDEDKKIWVNIPQEERKERYRQFRAGKEPTYEEWKAARLAAEKAGKDDSQV